jgi:hypothetical protein
MAQKEIYVSVGGENVVCGNCKKTHLSMLENDKTSDRSLVIHIVGHGLHHSNHVPSVSHLYWC